MEMGLFLLGFLSGLVLGGLIVAVTITADEGDERTDIKARLDIIEAELGKLRRGGTSANEVPRRGDIVGF